VAFWRTLIAPSRCSKPLSRRRSKRNVRPRCALRRHRSSWQARRWWELAGKAHTARQATEVMMGRLNLGFRTIDKEQASAARLLLFAAVVRTN
jgi:hypothetical protein